MSIDTENLTNPIENNYQKGSMAHTAMRELCLTLYKESQDKEFCDISYIQQELDDRIEKILEFTVNSSVQRVVNYLQFECLMNISESPDFHSIIPFNKPLFPEVKS